MSDSQRQKILLDPMQYIQIQIILQLMSQPLQMTLHFPSRNNKDVEMSQQKPEDTETISRHGDTLAIFQTMLDNLYSPRECEEE